MLIQFHTLNRSDNFVGANLINIKKIALFNILEGIYALHAQIQNVLSEEVQRFFLVDEGREDQNTT